MLTTLPSTETTHCPGCRRDLPDGAFAKNGQCRRKRCGSCENAARARPERRQTCACGAPKRPGRGQLYCDPCAAAARARRRRRATDCELRRHAIKTGAHAEDVDRAVVWERDEGICGICGAAADPGDWHLDHVIPLARGGAHTMGNVQVSHPVCNMRKGANG